MTADSRDHFVPRSWRRVVDVWRKGIWLDAPDTVPCCKECNSTAGAIPFGTLAEKRAFIQDRYKRKYARLLATPFRSEADLGGYGKNLRSYMERAETKKLWLVLRLAWPIDVGEEIEAFCLYCMREDADAAEPLNIRRRREILA